VPQSYGAPLATCLATVCAVERIGCAQESELESHGYRWTKAWPGIGRAIAQRCSSSSVDYRDSL